jgi:ABC-type transport system involved in multi-copper enzyme maturation permease subunit
VIAALRYEWTRITTIRSSYWVSAIAVLVATGLSTLISWALSDSIADFTNPGFDISFLGSIVVTQFAAAGGPYLIAFVVAILGILAWGHEYRHGMIRATFTAVPSRSAIWLAKYVVTLAWVVVTMILTFLTSSFVGWLFLGKYGVNFFSSVVLKTEGKALLVGVLLVAFMMGATAVLRHQTASMVLLFIWPLIIENILFGVFTGFPSLWKYNDWLSYLPFRALFKALESAQVRGAVGDGNGGGFAGLPHQLSVFDSGLVFLAYVAVVTVASLVLLRRRDA